MTKKRTRPVGTRTARALPAEVSARLSEAEALMARKRWREAEEILVAIDQRYPRRIEVLAALLELYQAVEDTRQIESTCRQLLSERPDDPDLHVMLASAYMLNLRPVLALRMFRTFLDRWPKHRFAREAAKSADRLTMDLPGILAEMGLAGEDDVELAALHEESQSLMDQGQFEAARRAAEQLSSLRPEFIPALNNLSQILFAQGNREQAIQTAQRALALDPENHHALSNLSRFFLLSGQIEQARECATRLKAVRSDRLDVWVKKAEALSYLGEDQEVLSVFEEARQAGYLKSPLVDPLLYHLAAVASLRLGKEQQARQDWKHALKLSPALDLAQDNLADLGQPVGQRHAPWPFALHNWISASTLQDLAQQLKGSTREEAARRAARRYLERHPEVTALLSPLLDRGDPEGRQFALRVALLARTPETMAALKDFSLSDRGPDALRQEAARAVSEAGLLPPGPVRLWAAGQWRDVLLLGFELHEEPLTKHSPRVEQWLADGTVALAHGEGSRAEELLAQALKVEPDAPDLLNNLAVAYALQGREQEAELLVRQVHERHPDYVFARTSLARLHLSRGEIEQADALIKPLFSRPRFHLEEFSAFCSAQIELIIAQGRPEAVPSWLEMWSKVDPENPAIDRWRAIVRKGKP